MLCLIPWVLQELDLGQVTVELQAGAAVWADEAEWRLARGGRQWSFGSPWLLGQRQGVARLKEGGGGASGRRSRQGVHGAATEAIGRVHWAAHG